MALRRKEVETQEGGNLPLSDWWSSLYSSLWAQATLNSQLITFLLPRESRSHHMECSNFASSFPLVSSLILSSFLPGTMEEWPQHWLQPASLEPIRPLHSQDHFMLIFILSCIFDMLLSLSPFHHFMPLIFKNTPKMTVITTSENHHQYKQSFMHACFILGSPRNGTNKDILIYSCIDMTKWEQWVRTVWASLSVKGEERQDNSCRGMRVESIMWWLVFCVSLSHGIPRYLAKYYFWCVCEDFSGWD